MTWPVLIETWTTEVLAFVPNLPGLQISGATSEEAFAAATRAVGPYVAWLVTSELLPEGSTPEELKPGETKSAIGTSGPIFSLDKVHPDEEQIELALAVGRAALSDLLFMRDDLPADRRPEADRVLQHVAELDRWYATRISEATGNAFHSIEDELVQSASLFEETIDLATTTSRPDVWKIDGEQWSIAKVLRRRTGHLREHLTELMAHLE